MFYGQPTFPCLSLIVARVSRWVATFMMTVLLVNLLSTAALSAQGTTAFEKPGLAEQTLVICTPQGLKIIPLDVNGQPLEDSPVLLDHCIYCLPFQTALMAVWPVSPLPPLFLPQVLSPHGRPHDQVIPESIPNVYASRAPPVV